MAKERESSNSLPSKHFQRDKKGLSPSTQAGNLLQEGKAFPDSRRRGEKDIDTVSKTGGMEERPRLGRLKTEELSTQEGPCSQD